MQRIPYILERMFPTNTSIRQIPKLLCIWSWNIRTKLAKLLVLNLFLTPGLLFSEAPDPSTGYFGIDRYEEQISCHEQDCIRYTLDELNSKGGKSEVRKLLEENAGKVLVDLSGKNLKLADDELDDLRDFLLEISKRDGRVAIEKLHIAIRGLEIADPPILKDVGLIGWGLIRRIYRSVYFKRTGDYNAKVLYHPGSGKINLIFFVHKRYGDICETVFSSCNEIEYLDEDTFDLQLSTALRESKEKNLPVRVNFKQVQASFPETKLEWENVKSIGRSARMYKWLALPKETEMKPLSRSRFLPLQAALTVIDYSVSVFDYVNQIIMYKPARSTKAEVLYTQRLTEDGTLGTKTIHSVVFVPVKEE